MSRIESSTDAQTSRPRLLPIRYPTSAGTGFSTEGRRFPARFSSADGEAVVATSWRVAIPAVVCGSVATLRECRRSRVHAQQPPATRAASITAATAQ